MSNQQSQLSLPPLEITCTTTKCSDGLHCWRTTKRQREKHKDGACIACGAELIDWDRVHRRDLADARFTFDAMQREFIRHHYWHHVEMTQRAVNYALRKGRADLRVAVRKKLATKVGPAHPYNDGGQTPMGGNDPVAYAQHATASCCRKCLREWHGVDEGVELSDDVLDYLTDLAMMYLDQRIPALGDEPRRIPFIRST